LSSAETRAARASLCANVDGIKEWIFPTPHKEKIRAQFGEAKRHGTAKACAPTGNH
jgi:hypothetical protein